jgi:hypothetical protein
VTRVPLGGRAIAFASEHAGEQRMGSRHYGIMAFTFHCGHCGHYGHYGALWGQGITGHYGHYGDRIRIA